MTHRNISIVSFGFFVIYAIVSLLGVGGSHIYVYIYIIFTTTITLILIIKGKIDHSLVFLSTLLIWDLASQEVIPVVTRFYATALTIIIVVANLLRHHKRKLLPVLPIVGILLMSSVIGIVRYVSSGNANDLQYSSMLIAGSLIIVGIWNVRDRAQALFTVSLAYAIGLSSGLYSLLDLIHATSQELIILPNAIWNEERLGNFSFAGGNYAGFLFGLGTISSFIYISQSFDNKIHGTRPHYLVIMIFAFALSAVGLFLTKTISAISGAGAVLFLVILFRTQMGIVWKLSLATVFAISISMITMNFVEQRDFVTFSGRTLAWLYSTDGIAQSPIVGLGFSDLVRLFPSISYERNEVESAAFILTPHNIFLAHTLYFGIPLGFIFLIINVKLIFASVKQMGNINVDVLSLALFVYATITHAFVDLWSPLYFFGLGLMIKCIHQNKKLGRQ